MAETAQSSNPSPDGSGGKKADDRGSRRTIVGTVSSTAMQKTVVVTVIRRVRDRRFHKFVVNRVHYKAHDEHDTCEVGDVVEIQESRPYSKTKRWRVLRVLEKTKEIAATTEQVS